MIALAEGIAIARSFPVMENKTTDGNKEMKAFVLMNIVVSLTSCYLTTGPFSKTAVNYNSGCKTTMSNVVMAVIMGLTLLFLAHVFNYTPIVALSAFIMSAMFGLIEYEKAYHLFKTDKFNFYICMSCFVGVAFISMDVGLMMSVALALIRALLYIARPATCKVGNIPNSNFYHDIEQYPNATGILGILPIKLDSPMYFANSGYITERILRYVLEEQTSSKEVDLEYILLDLEAVTSLDITGVETLVEIKRSLEARDIKPLFPGESGVDQLVEIIKILGTPTREEIKCMNPNYNEYKFPQIKAHPWHKSTGAYKAASRLPIVTPPPACVLSRGIGWHVWKDLIK